jgi:hypothetical protein
MTTPPQTTSLRRAPSTAAYTRCSLDASLQRLRRPYSLLALLAVAFAAAYPMQVNGFNQNAHYALVRALADGTPRIDKTRYEIGDLGTNDVQLYKGHFYSNKAPGLAFLTLPAYEAVDASGYRTTGDPTRPIWPLHVWSLVLPFLVLLLLVRDRAERTEPGLGTAAAVTFGLGTLALPFATLFFSHVLAATLGFIAFFLLWYEREGPRRPLLVLAAGLAVGLAITTEYALVLVAFVLGLYVLATRDLRRAFVYVAGVAAGTLPLALYNTWAFGSITHLTYENNQVERVHGFLNLALGWPSPRYAWDLLFSVWGLVTLTPVIVCGLAGALLLYRGGRRAEPLVCVGIAVIFYIWDASLGHGTSPFGGLGPPRYLIPILPFLAVPFAAAFRSFPATTLALAVVSAFQMVVQTATNPLAAYDGDWMTRMRTKSFSQTAASLFGITGWYTIALFFVAVLAAVAFAALATGRLPVPRWDVTLAPIALLAWALVALQAHNPAGRTLGSGYVIGLGGAAAVLAFAGLAGARLRPLRAR